MADGRAMAAFNVVGVNFQLRLSIHHSVSDSSKFLLTARVGFLRVFVHDDLAVEYSVRGAVQNPLIELEASGVRLQVIDFRKVIDMLLVVGQVKTIEHAFCTSPFKATWTLLRTKDPLSVTAWAVRRAPRCKSASSAPT